MSPARRPPGPQTENQIIHRAQQAAGQDRTPSLEAGLGDLFEAYRDRTYQLCLRMVGDPQRAEELVQETLLVASQRLPEFDDRARFGTWIYGIARNLCRNAVRRKGELLSEDGVLDAQEEAVGALSQLRAAERADLLQAASLAVLDEQEQEIVYLRYVENLSQEEITALLQLPGTGARGVLQRCRRKLGRELRERLAALGHGPSLFDRTISD